MAEFLTIDDLYSRVGAQKVNGYFDDANNGVLSDDSAAIDDVLCAAEGEYFSRMLKAYPGDWTDSESGIRVLVENDRALKMHVAWIALEFAAERRPEFCDEEGWGPYKIQYERALKYIENVAKAIQATPGSQEAGDGANVGGMIQPSPPQGTKDQFIFAPSRDSKYGHGGF